MKTALTIAGSDSSGGAGIQADLKTMSFNGVYAMSVITSLTAQNTTGVSRILDIDPDFVKAQIDAVFTDIRVDAVKIGMVSSGEIILAIAEKLREYKAKNIVLDPVMVATSGARLIDERAISDLEKNLFPLADLLTPNIKEAEILANKKIDSTLKMEEAAKFIGDRYSCAVLLKGGHMLNDANDYLYDGKNSSWFYGERIDNPNTHGTGCTLSSAIAANLAKGFEMNEAVSFAKKYLYEALNDMLDLGKGSGPINHGFNIKDSYKKLKF